MVLLAMVNNSGSQPSDSTTCAEKKDESTASQRHMPVRLTDKREHVVMIPRELPANLRGLWCSSRKCDYLIYARGQHPEHLMVEIQKVLALVSPQDSIEHQTNPQRQ
jgi:hypothetical protein